MTGPYVPFRYWPERARAAMAAAYTVKSEATGDRIRAQAQRPSCSCARPGEPADDGRCVRCWGWPT